MDLRRPRALVQVRVFFDPDLRAQIAKLVHDPPTAIRSHDAGGGVATLIFPEFNGLFELRQLLGNQRSEKLHSARLGGFGGGERGQALHLIGNDRDGIFIRIEISFFTGDEEPSLSCFGIFQSSYERLGGIEDPASMRRFHAGLHK